MSKEQHFNDSDVLLSTTDLDSYIKYANPQFCQIAGYSPEELQDQPHNVVRHPDMPKQAFADLWQHVQQGKTWMGPVKNRCKNGDFYWVNAFVTPIKDEQGKVVEYQSVRTKPERELVNRATSTYQQLNAGKTPAALKKQTDISLWVLSLMVLSTLVSIFSVISASGSWILPAMLSSLLVITTALFFNWRQKYRTIVREAKAVYDNPLMSYLYSGSYDDLGQIKLALQKRKAEIRAVVGRVNDDATTSKKTAEQSAKHGNDVANILDGQKLEIDQVAAAINEMSATVQEIANVVTIASESASKGQNISDSGQTDVASTITAISQLAEQLTVVENTVKSLVNGTKTIESVLSEISGIADQTNLLALNAAIEAARAGEQGRGFAVVAEEVRALAMRTQSSTEEINKLLAGLQQESDNAIAAVQVGTNLSQSCVALASKTGVSLQSVHNEVSELANISLQIATAIEEQSVVAEQINQSIVSIASMSYDSEQKGKDAKDLSEQLLARIKSQHTLIEQFDKAMC